MSVEPVKENMLTRSLPRTASVTSSILSREQEIVVMTPDGMPASSANCNKMRSGSITLNN